MSKFDWPTYVDATFAGLAVLVPLPMIDLLLEWFFRRRMPGAIAQRNGRTLSKRVTRELNRTPISCTGWVFWPILLVLEFLKRTYRTILYFLTIKAATDLLSYYWHRAFLINYMVQQDHLEDEIEARIAILAFNEVLDGLTTSPLTKLAQQVVSGALHILRTSIRWVRQQQEDEVVVQTRQRMADAWERFDDYFGEIASRYDEVYGQMQQRVRITVDS